LGAKTPNGRQFIYGFYPAEEGEYVAAGASIWWDADETFTHRRVFPICPETYEILLTDIRADRDALRDQVVGNEFRYTLLDFNFGDRLANCTTWALEKMLNAGFRVPRAIEPCALASLPGFSPVRWRRNR
jgi:hypothetical protein